MTCDDLHPDQARKVMATVGRQLRYLNHLQRRMQTLGFPPQDPLWRAALRAHDATQQLYMAAHYASCKSGVGRPAATTEA